MKTPMVTLPWRHLGTLSKSQWPADSVSVTSPAFSNLVLLQTSGGRAVLGCETCSDPTLEHAESCTDLHTGPPTLYRLGWSVPPTEGPHGDSGGLSRGT